MILDLLSLLVAETLKFPEFGTFCHSLHVKFHAWKLPNALSERQVLLTCCEGTHSQHQKTFGLCVPGEVVILLLLVLCKSYLTSQDNYSRDSELLHLLVER